MESINKKIDEMLVELDKINDMDVLLINANAIVLAVSNFALNKTEKLVDIMKEAKKNDDL